MKKNKHCLQRLAGGIVFCTALLGMTGASAQAVVDTNRIYRLDEVVVTGKMCIRDRP